VLTLGAAMLSGYILQTENHSGLSSLLLQDTALVICKSDKQPLKTSDF
jgi:hypothetical protein